MENEQLNVRVSNELLKDLDLISKLLKINRSEWLKTKIAEEVSEEKNRLLIELSTLYVRGMISKKNIEGLVGKEIADEMEFIKKKAEDSKNAGLKYGRELKKRIRV